MLLGASLCKDILVILAMISHIFIYLSVYYISIWHWSSKESVWGHLIIPSSNKNQGSKPSSIRWSVDHHHCHGEWERYVVTLRWRWESRLYKSRPLILWETRTLLLPGKMKIPASNITISPAGDWSTYSLSAFHRQKSLLSGLGKTIAFAMTFDYSQWLQPKSFLFC